MEPQPQHARILVIDDEPKLGSILARVLAPEHEVLVLTSAREAFDRLGAGDGFDLILCDLGMPGVDGITFCEGVRAVSPELTKRIVLMTGGAFSRRAEEFLAESSIPWIAKPFDLEEVRSLVREQLARRQVPLAEPGGEDEAH
jgi:CheY-like chemotaxis protein